MKKLTKILGQSCSNIPPQTQINNSLQSLATLLALLDSHDNNLQAIRQELTMRADFNPETLFNYLTGNGVDLTRNHLLEFMKENNQFLHEEELKIIFSAARGKTKEKMNYITFLNFLFPYSINTLKQISTVTSKKYSKNLTEPINEDILCLFMMTIKGEATFLREFQVAKSESFPRLSRDKIKQLIKKMGQKTKATSEFQSDNVITYPELKGFMKKMNKTPENRMNSVCRKLSLGTDEGIISLEHFQFWLKSWTKIKNQAGPFLEKDSQQKTLVEDISDQFEEIAI